MITTQSGVLLIDKPVGPSSAQVVHRVKAILRAKKVGHLGTLDPFASGLLLVGVNEGTKIADIFLAGAKSYRGVMALGVETDSQDGTGKIIRTCPVSPIGFAELNRLENRFTGDLKQTPPMFSALRKNGVRLYQLARQGKEIPREPRSIRIDSLRLRLVSDTEIEFDVTCSRGTYVRTLAADMGRELGCGAHLKSLRRTACDHLAVEQAVTPDELAERWMGGAATLMSLRAALSHLPAVAWQSRLISRLRLGQQDVLTQLGRPREGEKLLGILDPRGALSALAEWTEDVAVGRWRLVRVFNEQV
ncbi:MAG TPA: tRNA pseudouridine(55) synthase TruB [Candidatus Binatia bacterium]|nr:tRNA pseudouridine(55) synthase TruB [Candidatus Binatia bacterium]